MSLGTNTFDPRDAALERDLREWLRSFDPGPATPALRARVGTALDAARGAASGASGGLAALRGLAGLAAAAALVVLAGAILAMFAGSRTGLETGAPDPTIIAPGDVRGPAALWWLPAVAAGAAAAGAAYVGWPALRRIARSVVPQTGIERRAGPGAWAMPIDRLVQPAIVLVSVAAGVVWLTRLIGPIGSVWPGVAFLAGETLPAVIVVPIVLTDPTAWRRRRWLVAGALLYPVSMILRIVLPPAVQATPAGDGSTIVALSPSMIAEGAWVVAPLILAIGVSRWFGILRGPSRLVTAVAIGICAGLEVAELAAAMLPGASWYVFDSALLGGELALTLVGLSVLRERGISWPAIWIALAGIAGLAAGIVGRSATVILYGAGPNPDGSVVSVVNALLPTQGSAIALYAAALVLAFMPRPNVHVSLRALRTAGLTSPDADRPDGPASDESLPRSDR